MFLKINYTENCVFIDFWIFIIKIKIVFYGKQHETNKITEEFEISIIFSTITGI